MIRGGGIWITHTCSHGHLIELYLFFEDKKCLQNDSQKNSHMAFVGGSAVNEMHMDSICPQNDHCSFSKKTRVMSSFSSSICSFLENAWENHCQMLLVKTLNTLYIYIYIYRHIAYPTVVVVVIPIVCKV